MVYIYFSKLVFFNYKGGIKMKSKLTELENEVKKMEEKLDTNPSVEYRNGFKDAVDLIIKLLIKFHEYK